jgi:hypothetical protein
MNKFIFLLILLLLSIAIPLFFNISKSLNIIKEGFDSYKYLGDAIGPFQNSESDLLVQDSYPLKNNIKVTSDTSNKIWWHYPTFKLGSYEQITNNLKYPNNPDIARCTPTEFCGSIYRDNQEKTNYIKPLPPIDPECGTRVGYFTTEQNLLPFRTNMSNILY